VCVCITPLGTGLGRSNILLSEISHKMQKYKMKREYDVFSFSLFSKRKKSPNLKKNNLDKMFLATFHFLRGEFLVPAFYTASKKE
jgi:hypothetical protein